MTLPRLLGWALAVCPTVQAFQGYWSVTSGPCTIGSDLCATSPNYPNAYTNGASCTIGVFPGDWNGYAINVESFSTEATFDTLTVNGQAYSGILAPQRITPTTSLTWKTDNSNNRPGWKICPQLLSWFTTTAAPGSASASGTSSSNLGKNTAEIGAIVGSIGGIVVLVLVGFCYYWRFVRHQVKDSGAEIPKVTQASSAYSNPGIGGLTPASQLPEKGPGSPSLLPPISGGPSGVVGGLSPGTVGASSPNLAENNPDEGPWIKIKRTAVIPPFEERKFPVQWALSEDTGGYSQVPLTLAELEVLQRMVDSTHKSIKTRDRKEGTVPRRLEVLGVERIENSDLWNKYSLGRYYVKMKRPHKCTQVAAYGGDILTEKDLPSSLKDTLQRKVNEVYLWHGTNPAAADSICQSGFRLRFAGSGAGSMYGPGAYFAECSSKSDEYAGEAPSSKGSGVYCLLLCRIVLGELLHMTTGGSETHPMIKAAMESEAYDSVLGDREASVGTYREFMVFQEDQIYPEYKILYRRIVG